MVPMRDGVRLATDIYRPSRGGVAESGRFPTILVRTPYTRSYRAEGAEPVVVDTANVAKMKVHLFADILLEEHGVIRHNSPRLARLLLEKFLLSSKAR